VWVTHPHAPGTPCRPITRTEIEQIAQIANANARP
jgi:hypothetical protein